MILTDIDDFLNEDGLQFNRYITELTYNQFDDIISSQCTDFDYNDNPLIRGDKSLTGEYYIVNPHYRRINWNWVRMCPLHLEFMSSDLWGMRGAPDKTKSVDFLGHGNNMNIYGRQYRVIPFDGSVIASTGEPGRRSLVGNYNKAIDKDFGVGDYLSSFINELKDFYDCFNDHTSDMKLMSRKLNEMFKDEKYLSCKERLEYIPRMYSILKERNIDFITYMTQAFSPQQYSFYLYKDFINTNGLAGWTDRLVLLERI